MVTPVSPVARTGSVSFSFAEDRHGQPQPVKAILDGFEYPGEVVVAPDWRSEFGEPLNGVSMFRLVLLQTSKGPSANEIADRRVCVAVQGAPSMADRRVGESKADYFVADGDSPSGRSIESDMRSLREVREGYVASNDPGLSRLLSSLAEHESKINEALAGASHESWKSGKLITSDQQRDTEINPLKVFLLDNPESWVEATAAFVLDRSGISGSAGTLVQVFENLKFGRIKKAKEELRKLSGLHLGELTPLDRIGALRHGGADSSTEIPGVDLVDLLIHDLGFPPSISSLWALAYTLDSDSEVELVRGSGERHFVSKDNISERSVDDVKIDEIAVLWAVKSNDWDAVLPFLQLIAPHANSTRYGGGRNSDSEEFNLQLATVCDRVRQITPVMLSLEVATGATDRPLTQDATKLIKVLESSSWLEYVGRSRDLFGSVSKLRSALSGAAMQWSVIEVAPEIERAIYYLDQVEFGRVDHALAVERQMLRARFELESLVQNPSHWLSLRDEFERWRLDYRRAYLEDHADKQEHNRNVEAKIDKASRRVRQIELLERVDVVRSEMSADIAQLWNETIQLFAVCESDGSAIRLVDAPVCPDCHGRLGQPVNHTDITDMVSEIDRLFVGYRDRLASVVSNLVMKSANSDKLESLFRLNSAGDLSDLANVLDDKVISFLNELLGESNGNSDDWASPHS